MSARARKSYRSDRPHETFDDPQQQALLDVARREREGDQAREAFSDLWVSQQAWLAPWSQRKVPRALAGKLDADDLLQEISGRAWRGWKECRSVSIEQFRGWLTAIGEHALTDSTDFYLTALCREAAREELFDERALANGEQRPWNAAQAAADDLVMLIELEAFAVWFAALTDRQRVIYLWHERDGRSFADIAQELGCCPRTVRRAFFAIDQQA